MRHLLKKAGRYNIGATDYAANNLYLKKQAESGGYSSYIVYEGDKSRANPYIRRGAKPGGVPSEPDIRVWAGAKGITFKNKEDMYKKGGLRAQMVKKKSRRGPNKGRIYGQSLSNKEVAQRAMYLIRKKITAYGSINFRNWVKAPPPGRGRFDYPVQALREIHTPISRKVGKAAAGVGNAVVYKIMSGRTGKKPSEIMKEVLSGGQSIF